MGKRNFTDFELEVITMKFPRSKTRRAKINSIYMLEAAMGLLSLYNAEPKKHGWVGWYIDIASGIIFKKYLLQQLGRFRSYLPKIVAYCRKGHDSLTHSRMLTSFRKLQLFETHLKDFDLMNQKMKTRLQTRMLIELKIIARLITLNR